MAKRLIPHVRIVLHFLKMNVDELVTWSLTEIGRLQRDPDLKEPIVPIAVLKKQVIDLLKTRRQQRFVKTTELQYKEKVQVNKVLNSFTYIAFQVATIANDKAGGDEPIARIIIDRLGFKARVKAKPKNANKKAEQQQNTRASKRKRAVDRWQLESSPVTVYLNEPPK